MTKTAIREGAVEAGDFEAISMAVLDQDAEPPGFNIVFHRYNRAREERYRDIVMHVPHVTFSITFQPVNLIYSGAITGGSQDHDKKSQRWPMAVHRRLRQALKNTLSALRGRRVWRDSVAAASASPLRNGL